MTKQLQRLVLLNKCARDPHESVPVLAFDSELGRVVSMEGLRFDKLSRPAKAFDGGIYEENQSWQFRRWAWLGVG